MTNELIVLKIQERTNKLASNDYGDIEPWMILEVTIVVAIDPELWSTACI